MLGHNPRTAQRAGVSAVRAGGTALVIGGAMAGLAGAAMLTGGTADYRFTPGFANTSAGRACSSRSSPATGRCVCIPMAFVFAVAAHRLRLPRRDRRRPVDRRRRPALLVLALLVPPAVEDIRRRRAMVEAASPALPSAATASTALGGAPA